MRFSLRYRIAATIFILEAIMMGFVLWNTLGLSLESTKTHLTDYENALLGVVSEAGRTALLVEEFSDFQPYLEKTRDDPRVETALLLDASGRIMASTNVKLVGQAMPAINTHGEHVWRLRELTNATGLLGTLAIEFSNASLIAANRETRNLGIMIALVGMTLIAVVGLVAGSILTSRLQSLKDAALEIAQGRSTRLPKMTGHDELSDLGNAFSHMAQDLEDERHRTQAAHNELEQRVASRTRELSAANQELESFSYSVSHDLRAPLRAIDGFSQALLEDYNNKLDETGVDYLNRVRRGAQNMAALIDDMLQLSRITRQNFCYDQVNLSNIAQDIVDQLHKQQPDRKIDTMIQTGVQADGDDALLRIALTNLLENAWKYTSKKPECRIVFGTEEQAGERVFYVKDNGTGFDMRYIDKLFGPFQRLHSSEEFPGTGVGLATVKRVISRHGGRVWAEGEIDKGAGFYFTLPSNQ